MAVTVVVVDVGKAGSHEDYHFMREDEYLTLCGRRMSTIVPDSDRAWPPRTTVGACPKCLKAGGKRFSRAG